MALAGSVVSVMAVVEHDNVLKGLLKGQGFSVLQDVNAMSAGKPGVPMLQFSDGKDGGYLIAAKLNTVVFAQKYTKGIERFVESRDGIWNGAYMMEVGSGGEFVRVTTPFKPKMDEAYYVQVLDTFRYELGLMYKELSTEVKAKGADAAVVRSGPATDPSGIAFTRQPFERRDEFVRRIESGNPYVLGKCSFDETQYDIERRTFPVKVRINDWGTQVLQLAREQDYVLEAGRDTARSVYENGPDYVVETICRVDEKTQDFEVEWIGFTLNKRSYALERGYIWDYLLRTARSLGHALRTQWGLVVVCLMLGTLIGLRMKSLR
ncbi:MAG: hypothetical protein EOM20_04125 [Spartobacteria bacterium]|nr:hypothetical protein [Spartobacteria bacterium]